MVAGKIKLPQDRDLLSFIFARFIDGEFTGLKEGHALNFAPTLEAADFLALQIRDEIRHAKMYAALYTHCVTGTPIPRAPRLLNWIMAPISGRLWVEHCLLDKAIGERWVLRLMELLIQQCDDRKITNALKAIARDEERHIAFGTEQTRKSLTNGKNGFLRYYLWGLFLRVDFALYVAFRLTRRIFRRKYPAHAALLEDFFSQTREQILLEAADILDVAPRRFWLQMIASQVIFAIRYIYSGWTRNPRKSFGK
jgi:hypothetical protein